MVQEFVDDVLVNWETKLIFFDRVYSHAVLVSPIHGVNDLVGQNAIDAIDDAEEVSCEEPEPNPGGSRRVRSRYIPDDFVIKKAGEILDLIEGRLPYARVDVVVGTRDVEKNDLEGPFETEKILYLMEVELIEPSLYFEPSSAGVFGDLILNMVGERRLRIGV